MKPLAAWKYEELWRRATLLLIPLNHSKLVISFVPWVSERLISITIVMKKTLNICARLCFIDFGALKQI